jgi:hypothetical protein
MMENEGTTANVDENKGSILGRWVVTGNVYEE